MADPGTHSDEKGELKRAVAALITVGGWFLSATMLGLVVESIQAKMEELKKGASRVVEVGPSSASSWLVIESVAWSVYGGRHSLSHNLKKRLSRGATVPRPSTRSCSAGPTRRSS